MFKRYLPVIIASLILYSCNSTKQKTTDYPTLDSIQKIANQELKIDNSEIRRFINTGEDNSPYLVVSNNYVLEYYKNEKNPLLWLGTKSQPAIDILLEKLKSLKEHAIEPEIFPINEIESKINKIRTLNFQKDNNINQLLADIEYNLTKAYLNYACFINYGYINPQEILNNLENEEYIPGRGIPKNPDGTIKKKKFYDIPLKSLDDNFMTQALNAVINRNSNLFLDSIQPKDHLYIRLKKEYQYLDSLAQTALQYSIPELGTTILKKGDEHKAVPSIIRALSFWGYLPKNDSLNVDSLKVTHSLIEALNKFRIKNSISEDETIGDFTLKALNRPVDYYKNCIKLNMERLRWKQQLEKGNKYVKVNIPAFMLQAFDSEADSILEMKICCGTIRNKTPILSSKITYMDLNPYWNVPQSIIRKEIVPSYKRDSTYFTRQRMKIYDRNGERVDPHSVDWSKYKGNVPFEIKQDNRQGNSLGRLIFRFPNEHAVYLHDTPVQSAFKRANRSVSHGCVRIEKPLNFAFYLLNKQDEVLKDRIRAAIDLKPQSEAGKAYISKSGYKEMKQYRFEKSTPLFLDYYTIFLNKDNELFYCTDVYKYDELLLPVLNNKLNELKKTTDTDESI